MKRVIVNLIIVFVVGITTKYAIAQNDTGFSRKNLMDIESYIGLPDSVIENKFGSPNEMGYEEGKEAVVWTYITRVSGEIVSKNPIIGYHQFAFWNGRVAGYRTRRFTDEEQASEMYNSVLDFMGENGHTIGISGMPENPLFTPNHRLSRRSDNLWEIDVLRDKLNSYTTLIVGDAGYRGCSLVVQSEAERIEKKFDIRVSNNGGIHND